MRYVPFTKFLFRLDDGYRDLLGTGLAATYEIGTQKLTWRNNNKSKEEMEQSRRRSFIYGLLVIPIYYALKFDAGELSTVQERLGQYYILVPVLLGIALFFIIQWVQFYIRSRYEPIEEPPIEGQIEYLQTCNMVRINKGLYWMRCTFFGKENTKQPIKTPYVTSLIAYAITFLLVFPCLVWLYLQPLPVILLFRYVLLVFLLPYFSYSYGDLWDPFICKKWSSNYNIRKKDSQ